MEEGTKLVCRKTLFPEDITMGDVMDSTLMHINDSPIPIPIPIPVPIPIPIH